MHINVSEILAGSVGERRTYTFEGERPDMDDLQLAADVSGQVDVMRSDNGVTVRGTAEGSMTLVCHRCMQAFDWPVSVGFAGDYALHPTNDELPISRSDTIDLAESIRQEFILAQPIKLLCREDCLGLCDQCGQPKELNHTHQTKLKKE